MSTNNTEKEFKLSSWAIENKMTIYVTMVMFLFLGLSAYYNMPREDFPEIKETKIYISTVYPGNTAEDIERLIVDPLEEELRNVSNVVKVLSTSQEDYGIITVEFDEKISVESAKQKVKDQLVSNIGSMGIMSKQMQQTLELAIKIKNGDAGADVGPGNKVNKT